MENYEEKIILALANFTPKANSDVVVSSSSDIIDDVLIESINVVGFLNRLEELFEIEIFEYLDELVEVRTVTQLVDFLSRH